MSDGYIKLVLGSLSLTIVEFTSEKFPRLLGEFEQPQFTAARNLVQPGNPYKKPERWEFECVVTKSEAATLKALYREHGRLVDTRQNARITLTDTILEIEELSSRTRAIAPSPFNTETTANGYVYYMGQFYVHFERPIEINFWGVNGSGEPLWAIACSLVESEETP